MSMSLHPINALVSEALTGSDLTAHTLIAGLGYKNFNKGKRHLDALVVGNSVRKEHKSFRDQIFSILAVAPEQVERARSETRHILLDLARQAAVEKDQQQPIMLLEAVFENAPSGMHGYMAQHAKSRMFGFKRMEPTILIPLITAIIRQRQKNARILPDRYPVARAYRFCVSSFERWIFDLNGNLRQKQTITPALGPKVDF